MDFLFSDYCFEEYYRIEVSLEKYLICSKESKGRTKNYVDFKSQCCRNAAFQLFFAFKSIKFLKFVNK